MFEPEKYDHLHLVYHFTVPLKLFSEIFRIQTPDCAIQLNFD